MAKFNWPWLKKKKDIETIKPVVEALEPAKSPKELALEANAADAAIVSESVKSGPPLNLRNPDQHQKVRDEEDKNVLASALAGVAAESMHVPIEECPAIFIECTCGSQHFRHAGYLETIIPYIGGEGNKTAQDSHAVKMCCTCRKSYISVSGKVYDVTSKVDLEAWKETEKKAHEVTGPGGEC